MHIGKYFDFKGRISRSHWWLGQLGSLVLFFVAIMIVGLISGDFGKNQQGGEMRPFATMFMFLTFIPYVWFNLSMNAKRWHDRDKSGWWMLIGLVPFIGGIWALIENGFLRGTDGPNRFGNNPLQDR